MKWLAAHPSALWKALLASAVLWGAVFGARIAHGDETPDDWRTQDVAVVAESATTPDAPTVRDLRTVADETMVPPANPFPAGPLASLATILGALAWAFVEALKGFCKRFADSPGTCKAGVAGLAGAVLGVLAFYIVPGPWTLLEAILAGVVGAGGFVGVRTSRKLLAGILPVLLACLGLLALPACSPAQRRAWAAFGTETRDCLLSKCHAPEIMVVGMQGGAWGDLLMEDLPCVLGCLGTSVAGAIEVARGEDRQTATWFGTSSEVRTIPTVRVRITPR